MNGDLQLVCNIVTGRLTELEYEINNPKGKFPRLELLSRYDELQKLIEQLSLRKELVELESELQDWEL